MADKVVQLMGFSATINYEENKAQALLAAELCDRVLAIAAEPKYDSLNVLGWTLKDSMLRWANK